MAPFIPNGPPTTAAFDERLAPFLAASAAVDRDHPAVRLLAREVRRPGDIDTVRVAYETVRDHYPHSMDIAASAVSVSASDVLHHGHGICFAKSHLLAAVLRACGIAAGLSYQKLAGGDRTYLHALTAVWLRDKDGGSGSTPGATSPASKRSSASRSEYLAFPIRPGRGERDFAEYMPGPCRAHSQRCCGSRTVEELARQLPGDLSAEG